MDYRAALDYLDSLTKFGIKFGLERISALSAKLGNPHKSLRAVHVGGTNGKGSTCTFLSSILHRSGYIVGTYLSPYVFDPRERIQINGEMISKEDFADLITRIREAAEEIRNTELGEVTEFEAKTMAAFLHFWERGVDMAVLEVGMGGRFDATNIIHPWTSVITNVTLDHMERLGSTVDAIAREKAGIIKPQTVVVTCAQDPDALNVIWNRCAHVGAELWRVMPSQVEFHLPQADFAVEYTVDNGALYVKSTDWAIGGLYPGLKGEFQYANAATAVAAAMSLERHGINLTPNSLFSGISEAYIPGRLQVVSENPLVVLDGAHNPDAALHLARTLKQDFEYRNLILVIGMLDNHSPDGVLAHIAPMASKIIATQSKWFKARKADEMASYAEKYVSDVETVYSIPEAVRRAQELAGPKDMILVTGSFYTIGEVNPNDLETL